MKNELTPSPSGKRFRELFSKEINVRELPCMHSNSLNKDVILYRAMLIILSNRLGVLETHLNIANSDDSVSDTSKRSLMSDLIHDYKSTVRFMKSRAMITLRDNEFASNRHENEARTECFRFLKE